MDSLLETRGCPLGYKQKNKEEFVPKHCVLQERSRSIVPVEVKRTHLVKFDVAALFVLFQSKGGILSKACEYIKELRQSNLKLGEDIGVLDRLRVDNQLLRQEVSQRHSRWCH